MNMESWNCKRRPPEEKYCIIVVCIFLSILWRCSLESELSHLVHISRNKCGLFSLWQIRSMKHILVGIWIQVTSCANLLNKWVDDLHLLCTDDGKYTYSVNLSHLFGLNCFLKRLDCVQFHDMLWHFCLVSLLQMFFLSVSLIRFYVDVLVTKISCMDYCLNKSRDQGLKCEKMQAYYFTTNRML